MKEDNLKNKNQEKFIIGFSVMYLIIAIICAVISIFSIHSNSNIQIFDTELARTQSYNQVQKGDDEVKGTDNVKFDAFFLSDINGDSYAESIRGTCKEIGKEDKIYMELKVQGGNLEDGKIEINGKNFYLQTVLPKDKEIKESAIGSNTKEILLNNMPNGIEKLIIGTVRSGDYTYNSGKTLAIGNNVYNYSKENSIVLTGMYVDETGNKIPIEKEVKFYVDWYGTTTAGISTTTQTRNIENAIDEENDEINLNFSVYTEETKEQLILKNNHVEGEIPLLNGYEPKRVEYIDSQVNFEYDETTRIFSIDKNAAIFEDETSEKNGEIINALSRKNTYTIKVTYPLEAYKELGEENVQLKIPITTYYEGYNNSTPEFKSENPYKSNIAKSTITITYQKEISEQSSIQNTYLDIKVGKNVYDPVKRYIVSKQKPLKIYNGQSEQEKDDTYTVMWRAYIGKNAKTDGLVLKETKDGETQVTDEFIKTNNDKESVDDVVSNIGIYFNGADTLLGENGWIKVYDEETGDLIAEFSKDNWNKYDGSNPYKYAVTVKHVKIVTSEIIQKESSLYVYSVKEIDDEKIVMKYDKEKFDELQYISSTLEGYLAGDYIGKVTHQAKYEAPLSIANISINPNAISTQETEKNATITITTQANENYNLVKWVNGIFLVKLPEEIIDVKINDVSINNDSVKIETYELIEDKGQLFIKIVTQNQNPETYEITIDADITPDPRKSTITKSVELYASNENGSEYYYKAQDIHDVNNNLNESEIVNHTKTDLQMIAPGSLLTNQTATDYDDKGSTVVSPQIADIKPLYAIVDKEQEEKKAKINVQVKNNYSDSVSEVILIGKIPFTNNTYVINQKDLGSTFTTKITADGIEIPEKLIEKVKVYYSEEENPDKDIQKKENGWIEKEKVENWDNIKTYLIDFGDYEIQVGEEIIFKYDIKIPNGLDFNDVSFSHHGVYFCLNTEQGKYRTQAEPNKLGFRIAEKYDLELIKYQKENESKKVSGATYSVTEIITNEDGSQAKGEAKTGVTDKEGKLKIKNLYAEKEYEIKEIKTPDDYEINEDVIRFIGHVNKDTGELTIDKKSGTTKEDIKVIKNEEENYKIALEVEDEVKASIKITKKEKGTEKKLAYVRYKLTGYGLSTNGKTITTNANGEASLKGLSVDKEYTLTEVKADGYYLASPIKFKIVNNTGNYSIEIINEEINTNNDEIIKEQNTTQEDEIPTINIVLEDEKIPTYDLEILKIKKVTQATEDENEKTEQQIEKLQGAKFKLYKGTEEIGEYITDAEGKIVINGLYQYEESKEIDQTYTLKEVLAPDGYAKVKDITFKVQMGESALEFLEVLQDEQVAKNYEANENTIKLTIEDTPSFKLIKKDAESQNRLEGIKFSIYNVDDVEQPARNSKGEILGTKETINGKEYYVVTTDHNGEITADLTEGLYKAVEVQAPDKYDLKKATYYFGIGVSREAEKSLIKIKNTQKIENSNINSLIDTSDGGYLIGGVFNTIIEEYDDKEQLGTGIIKYDKNENIEWAKNIPYTINSIYKTKNNGFIIYGSSSKNLELENGIKLTSGNLIVKYDIEGSAEWGKTTGVKVNCIVDANDGGYLVAGNFSKNITLDDGTNFNSNNNSIDGIVIKYTSQGKTEWGNVIGGELGDSLNSVVSTEDNGYIVVGTYCGEIFLSDNVTIKAQKGTDAFIVKYNSNNEFEWVKEVKGDYSENLYDIFIQDNRIIVGGDFSSHKIKVGDIDVNNSITDSLYGTSDFLVIFLDLEGNIINAKSYSKSQWEYYSSMIITSDNGVLLNLYTDRNIYYICKLDETGRMQWYNRDIQVNELVEVQESVYVTINKDGTIKKLDEKREQANIEIKKEKIIGGTESDVINLTVATSDGGYIIVGNYCGTIELENGKQFTSKGRYDGIVIKYNAMKEIEWANTIGGNDDDYMTSVIETTDGKYIVGGYFNSKKIITNNVDIENSGSYDSIILKYDADGNEIWSRLIGGSSSEQINALANSNDGGFIVGGYFSSTEINLENGITLNNNGGQDGMIIQYDERGTAKWVKVIGGSSTEEIRSVVKTKDGGFLIGGSFKSTEINLDGEIRLENHGTSTDLIIIKYGANKKVEWAKVIGSTGQDSFKNVIETSNGDIVAVVYVNNSVTLENGMSLSSGSSILCYDKNGKIKKTDCICSYGQSNSNDDIVISEIENDIYVVRNDASVNGITLDDNFIWYPNFKNPVMIKYNSNLQKQWIKEIGKNVNYHIRSILKTQYGEILVAGYFYDFIYLENGEVLKSTGNNDGVILKVNAEMGVPEVQELVVENVRKEFKITTDIEEIDDKKGGDIDGEDKTPYEIVKYGDSSQQQIKMTPWKDYEIIKVTVNGKEYPFEAEEDGTFTMPQFKEVTEDKHIVVTYSLKDNKIIINKVDSETGTRLTGAKFKLDQIEERKEPEGIIKDLVDNGQEYAQPDLENEVIFDVGKNLKHSDKEYWFEKAENGSYVPTNGKTYQESHYGTAGISSSTANSVVEIDLSDKDGQYVVVVNAEVSSQTSDYGYATINETESPSPSYSTTNGRFMYISGTITADDYTSTVLEGGTKYYLHLGYYKNGSTDTGDDQVVINSIKIYKAKLVKFGFIKSGEKYESNNIGKNNTTANSYIPIDLRGYLGKYNLTVNAKISSQSLDYGYVTINTSQDAPTHSNTSNRLIHISGTTTQEGTTVLDGNQIYYLHLGYYKDSSVNTGDDKFTVNSINITLNDSELYHTEVETNSDGQAITQVPFGKYSVTEIEVPEGYELAEEPMIIEFRSDEDHQNGFDFKNTKKGNIIVHHYIKGTTTQVAPDEYQTNKIGVSYTTQPHLDLEKYTLEENEDKTYVLPTNMIGEFKYEDQEIIYYYVQRKIPLIVHHYIKETQNKVPSADGGTVDDVISSGDEGAEYHTKPATNISEKYELSEIPDNADGKYEFNEVVVTYYYNQIKHNITTRVEPHDEKDKFGTVTKVDGGKITGQNENQFETVVHTENSKEEIIVTPEEGYQIKSIKANGQDVEYEENGDNTVTLNKFLNVTEDIEVVVIFEPVPTQVIVHHYIYDRFTGQKTTEKVPLSTGEVAEDEIKVGVIGSSYATQEKENLQANYEIYEIPTNSSGEMTKETINVIYYYIIKDAEIEDNITKTGTSEITSKTDKVDYTATYTATINDYQGNATLKIIDTLPYNIDTSKSNLDGGEYDETNKTITWTVEMENIDTIKDGEKHISVTKNFSVVYTNIDTKQKSLENTVIGNLELHLTDQEEQTEPAKAPTILNFKKNVTVTKSWINTNNIYGNPTRVILQVKNGDKVVDEKEVTGTDDSWTYTFENLDKYDNEGNEITYTAGESEVEEGDLKYYKSEVNGLNITNTYIGPIISQEKTAATEKGLDYVVENEKITYTITVTNEGGVEKDVIVKDTIPEGTTFVANSIKIDGISKTDKNQQNLENGITVNVPAKTGDTNGNATLSFDVTVNKLEEGIFTKQIKNKAIVDDQDTNEVIKDVKKPNISAIKESDIQSGSKVKLGDEITYYIKMTNDGTAPGEAIIKDTIPEGTTFVENSIKLNNEQQVGQTQDTLKSGITTIIEANEEVTLEFKVKVNDLEDGQEITNVATVNDNNTNQITHEYIEPIISQQKTSETEYGLDYVVQGEKITYTITVTNEGGLEKNVLIKDNIPEGTSFVEGSIKVNDDLLSDKTEQNLNEGIEVIVPKKQGEVNGIAKLSFEVIINDDKTGDIQNFATVDEKNTNETKNSIVTYQKNVSIERRDESIPLNENEAVVGDVLNYKITVKNTGTNNAHDITIKDSIPEGTTLTEIENGGINQEDVLTWTISELFANSETTVGFKVKVDYRKDEYTIENIATVDDKPTNETQTPYKRIEVELESSIEKTATEKITSRTDKVDYNIEFTSQVDNFVGKADVTIVDKLPFPIIKKESELDGGTYDEGSQTIIWKETIEDINTFEASYVKDITVKKSISLIFDYGNLDDTTGLMTNNVESTIELFEPETEDPSQLDKVKEDKQKDTADTTIELPTEILIHHYIYDEEKNLYTTISLAPDEVQEGIVGKPYTTSPSNEVPANYSCINTKPDKCEGKYTEKVIEVIYYYKLLDTVIENEIEKIAVVDKNEGDEENSNTGENDDIKEENDSEMENSEEEKEQEKNENGEETIDDTENIENPIDNKAENMEAQIDAKSEGTEAQANVKAEGVETPVDVKAEGVETQIDNNTENLEASIIANTQNIETPANDTSENPESQIDENKDNNTIPEKENPVITKEDESITYTIKYKVKIKDYIGKATVKITDQLPFEIDLEKSNLNDGIYDSENKTITWIEEIENIDTFVNGQYEQEISKEVSIVYVNQNPVVELLNTVTGAISIYYPEIHSTNPGEELKTETDSSEAIVDQDYKVDLKIQKEWDDNDNKKGNRPNSVTITVNEITNQKEIAKEILSENNNWLCEIKDLPKYDENTGLRLQYEVIETETEAKDLEYYENPIITQNETQTDEKTIYSYVVRNEYKLMKTDLKANLIKDGTKEITKSNQEVNYTINFTAEIEEYIGEGKVKIIDTLPYSIDENLSNLNGGIYNKENRTITWEDSIEHINTYEAGEAYKVNVSKSFSVVYKDIDLKQEKMTNKAKGIVELFETEQKDEKETTFDTDINVEGKVIVKYVDKDTNKDIEVLDENGKTKTYNYEIQDKVGKDYKTTKENIENYRFVEVKGKPEGKITEGEKTIVYLYQKIPAKVIVKYIEKDTEKELLPDDEINGFSGQKYETQGKIIDYYKLDTNPENSTGKMTEEDIVVKYYYRKLLFNMKIEKEIEEIILNENNLEVKDKNKTKIQVDYKDINDIKLEISYKIKVTNTEELEGKAILEEIIPKGFEMLLEKTNGNWEYNDGKYLLETESLKPGESQEYKVTLRWLPQATNEGEKVNIANIILTKNAPNYKEITENDNKDVAIIEILLNKIPNDEKVESKGILKKSNTPKTGDSIIVYLIILNSISICIIYILIKRKK